MADYYRTIYGSDRGRKGGRSALGSLLDIAMLVVTLGVIVLFMMTLIVPKIHPARSEELSTLGLIAPFTYAAVLVLMLYWKAISQNWKKVA